MASFSRSINSLWTSLPNDILEEILKNLPSLWDYLQFRVVCNSWYLVAQENEKTRREVQLRTPLLLVASTSKEREEEKIIEFYSVTKMKIIDFQLRLPKFYYYKTCWGSSLGWLIFVEPSENFTIILFNPFTKRTIQLPPLTKSMKDFEGDVSQIFLTTLILSKDPCIHSDDYEVAIMVFGLPMEVALFSSRDGVWNFISDNPIHPQNYYQDLIFHHGKVYAADRHMHIYEISLNPLTKNYEFALVSERQENHNFTYHDDHMRFLKTNEKDLLVVKRSFGKNVFGLLITTQFQVYKLELSKSSESPSYLKWILVNDLGDNAIFLGDNETLHISASTNPNCQPNCVYFTDNDSDMNENLVKHVNIFDIATQTITNHNIEDTSIDWKIPYPSWILPRLRED